MGHWRTATLSAVCVLLLVVLLLNSEDEVKTEVARPSQLRGQVEANPSKFGRLDVSGNMTQPFPEEAEELTLEEWMRLKEEGYERDRARIAKVCKKYGNKLKTDPAKGTKSFMVDKKHKWAYCRHGKV